ncbi:MAG: carboxypeptidase regulatory-like domain-containing protein [Ignavibacteria bacterium]|nr:carboxypeptidase regulatory-like domain-containing protein [Ignavibacteria bacterium]
MRKLRIGNLPLGNYTIKVRKPGFKPSNENFPVNGGHNSKDKSLDPDTENRIVLTEGKLYIYADNIDDEDEPTYRLSGNVNINGILFFGGDVVVEKTPGEMPSVKASSKIYAKNINGADETIMPLDHVPYEFLAEDNNLIPKKLAYFFEIPGNFAGFFLKLVGLTINTEGTEVAASTILNFPYPLNYLVGWEFKRF